MQLCAPDAIEQGFVTTASGGRPVIKRNNSVDLTIGKILKKAPDGTVVEHDTACVLEPQETVFLISAEFLHIKENHNAYVFLKNRLSRKGVIAFNTGLIDEGYDGRISTLVTNLSRYPVYLHPGTEFFRVVMHRFECTRRFREQHRQIVTDEKYTEYRKLDLWQFPASFLDQERIKSEINEEVKGISSALSIRNFSGFVAVVALLFALISIFTPWAQGFLSIPSAEETQAAFSRISSLQDDQEEIKKGMRDRLQQDVKLQRELSDYQSGLAVSRERIKELERRLNDIEGRLGRNTPMTWPDS